MSNDDKSITELQDLLQTDPATVAEVNFNCILWQKQREIINSVWANPRTAVKSCNSGGKSKIAAIIALLYLMTFKPSRVITTAPTFLQVEEILWKEIHAAFKQSKIKFKGCQLNNTSLTLGDIDGHPWDALGISTNEVNRFQGFKSPHLLVILDEALGVAPEIWEAMEGLQPHRILALGNPLEPEGNFYKAFQSDLWHKITIDGIEAVKWQELHGKIPGLVTLSWMEERALDWGKQSPLYLSRCRGEFPEETASTLISRAWVERARKGLDDENRPLETDAEDDSVKIVAADIATKHGENETVIGYRYGHTIKEIKRFYRIPTFDSIDRIMLYWSTKKATTVVVDSDGIGEGVADGLTAKRVPVTEFHGGYGHKAMENLKFRNLRSQFYWIVAKKFEKGLYNLSKIADKEYELLKNQLCAIKMKPPDAMGRIQIETKEDMMARGITSPDLADFFMMSEYGYFMSKFAEIKPMQYR